MKLAQLVGQCLLVSNCLLMNPKAGNAEPYKGWAWVAQSLIKQGHKPKVVAALFESKDFLNQEPVPFKLVVEEPKSLYQDDATPERISKAKKYLEDNASYFSSAQKVFKVSPFIIAALHSVETNCGSILGTQLVAYRIARIVSTSDPATIEWNYQRLKRDDAGVTRESVKTRARYLLTTFFPQLSALVEMHTEGKLDARSLRGSFAGAFGIPQFMPKAFKDYAVDGNHDGVVSLFDPADAIWSTAYYLSSHGWNDKAAKRDKLAVLWHYNRSAAYGDAVLRVLELLKAPSHLPARKASAKRK